MANENQIEPRTVGQEPQHTYKAPRLTPNQLQDIKSSILAIAAKYQHLIEDRGTCVIGAGIEVEHIPSRCRNPVRTLLVSNWQLGVQADCSEVFKLILSDLKPLYPQYRFRYNWGRMD